MPSKKPEKPKMGRPPIDPDERRDIPVKVLVTASEKDDMERAAQAQDLTLSTWLRNLVKEALAASTKRR